MRCFKICLAAALGLIVMTMPLRADGDKHAKTVALLEAMDVAKMVETMVPLMSRPLKPLIARAVPQASEAEIDAMIRAVDDSLLANRSEFIEMLVPVYQSNLSEDEISQALAFFTSPAGRAIVSKQQVMMQQGALVGQNWAAMQRPVIEQKVREAISALRESKGQAD